jgi:hypothetical protein
MSRDSRGNRTQEVVGSIPISSTTSKQKSKGRKQKCFLPFLFRSRCSLRRYFDVTAKRLVKRIDIVAEGVVRLDQKLDRKAAGIHDEMRRASKLPHAR